MSFGVSCWYEPNWLTYNICFVGQKGQSTSVAMKVGTYCLFSQHVANFEYIYDMCMPFDSFDIQLPVCTVQAPKAKEAEDGGHQIDRSGRFR